MATMQSLDIKRYSATTTTSADVPRVRWKSPSSSMSPAASAARHARRPAWNGTTCARRSASTSEYYDNPHRPDRKTLDTDAVLGGRGSGRHLEWLIRKDGCMHCEDPGCLKACPAPGAIVQYTNGIVDFVSENCIGCGYCVKGCPFNIPRISPKDHKAYKCTLCSDRVAVGQAPACAKACPTQAISFGTKEDMISLGRDAHRRPKGARLRERRSLRSPGRRRHPCDVRAEARRPPQIYANLPKEPKIIGLVEIWKGWPKPIALGRPAGPRFVHYSSTARTG